MVKNAVHSQRITDRFEIRDLESDLLGRGSMGEVYRATDTHTREPVAIKALDPGVVARDPGILERFVHEGEALQQLNHPNIVRMVAAVEDEGQHYLVMEYVAGGSLQDLLEIQRPDRSGRPVRSLPIPRVLEIALELADALTRAHHLGIIHRDLKPANVLLAEDGPPRLTDFGIAHVAESPRLTQTGILMGPVDYLSPEACEGEAIDERGDIWSFGVMLYEMLSGDRPFAGKGLSATLTAILTQPVPDLARRCPDAPEALVDLVYRMLEKDRGQRIPSALLTGIFFLALGFFKLGRLVRFAPYPVVGGFLAGTGWLLVQGSFDVMAGSPLTLANLPVLFQPERLILWVPGVLFALVLYFGLQRIRHFLAMPGILLGAIALFYLALLLTSTSIEGAIESGLLLGRVAGEIAWQPLALRNLLAADWAAILGQAENLAILLLLSVVGFLLNASSLELAIRRDVDLNRELQSAGFANLLSGLGGGMAGYHALSLSALSYRIGARGRLPGLLAGAICLALLSTGSTLLAFFPVPILGGLLFFLGLDFLVDWVIRGWSRLSRPEYGVVLLILVVIAVAGFLVGVAVGLVAMIILFILSYSRINVVHHAGTGAEIRSSVERCAYHRQVLAKELGPYLYILELQGFIFFGTANALLDQIRARVTDTDQPPVRYIVLDFRRVTGLDSSAVISFVKGKQLAEAQTITLVLTHLSERIREQLALGGLFEDEKGVHVFPDLDHGLEWCEEELLEIEGITAMYVPITLSAQLADGGFEKADTARLMGFLDRVEIKKGEYLIQQGDEADDLYFIELGNVSIYLEIEGGERVRLQTLGLGTAVGELDLYLGTSSTASVIADSLTVAYRLTRAALSRMKEEEPKLAATFHEFVAHLLSERLAATTRTLEAVLR